ncbi:hypothetical protein F5148DRAFT_1370655 [Russula earlei]|uniref:Uncharacterized protein n=1 Tax=Russula earlei TaxID=71964 RepID=A0ACC0TWX8_9AGAM|nr:hypothetical protein F5148DRAFT_1370655 [Russula earlei]
MSTPETVKQVVKDISAISSALLDAVPRGSKDDKIWSVLVSPLVLQASPSRRPHVHARTWRTRVVITALREGSLPTAPRPVVIVAPPRAAGVGVGGIVFLIVLHIGSSSRSVATSYSIAPVSFRLAFHVPLPPLSTRFSLLVLHTSSVGSWARSPLALSSSLSVPALGSDLLNSACPKQARTVASIGDLYEIYIEKRGLSRAKPSQAGFDGFGSAWDLWDLRKPEPPRAEPKPGAFRPSRADTALVSLAPSRFLPLVRGHPKLWVITDNHQLLLYLASIGPDQGGSVDQSLPGQSCFELTGKWLINIDKIFLLRGASSAACGTCCKCWRDCEDLQGLDIALDSKQQEVELIKCRMSVKSTAGTTPAPGKVNHIRRKSTTLSPPSTSRPASRLSDTSKDVPKVMGKISEPPSTTLGKSVRINSTATTPPSTASNSKVPTPTTVKPAWTIEGSMCPPLPAHAHRSL